MKFCFCDTVIIDNNDISYTGPYTKSGHNWTKTDPEGWDAIPLKLNHQMSVNEGHKFSCTPENQTQRWALGLFNNANINDANTILTSTGYGFYKSTADSIEIWAQGESIKILTNVNSLNSYSISFNSLSQVEFYKNEELIAKSPNHVDSTQAWTPFYEQFENNLSASLELYTTNLSFYNPPSFAQTITPYQAILKPIETIFGQLTYELIQSPSGVNVNQQGYLTWTSPTEGEHDFVLRVTNNLDIDQNKSWSVSVSQNNEISSSLNEGGIQISTIAEIGQNNYQNFIVKKVLNTNDDFDANSQPIAPILYQLKGDENHEHGIYEINFSLNTKEYIGEIPVELWIKKNESAEFKRIINSTCLVPGSNQWSHQKLYWQSQQIHADGLGDNWSSDDIAAAFGNSIELKITFSN